MFLNEYVLLRIKEKGVKYFSVFQNGEVLFKFRPAFIFEVCLNILAFNIPYYT